MQLPKWAFGPFVKDQKPILVPDGSLTFFCPVSKRKVRWQDTNVYNPALAIKDGVLHLFYRADDTARPFLDTWGNPMVTCRIGHAVSEDGFHFRNDPEPVVYPDEDAYKRYEWDGGCQDLHIVESEDGRFYMNYTAWVGSYDKTRDDPAHNPPYVDVLMVASSEDLVHWKKHGPAFAEDCRNHTRSGVIVSELVGDKLIARKIGGKYVMYAAHNGWMSTSEDLVHWEPVLDGTGKQKCLFPDDDFAKKPYANASCEAGAAAILTDDGIVYFFNAAAAGENPSAFWTQGQALVDKNDLCTVLDVLEEPHLFPEYDWEKKGHVPTPCLVCNGITHFHGKWTMYYGASDHVIGRAAEKSLSEKGTATKR